MSDEICPKMEFKLLPLSQLGKRVTRLTFFYVYFIFKIAHLDAERCAVAEHQTFSSFPSLGWLKTPMKVLLQAE